MRNRKECRFRPGCDEEREETCSSRAALEAYLSTIGAEPTFQQRVQPWMLACFGAEIAADKVERNHRFLEEALELVQATGCTAGEAHQLVDYVYGRPVGDALQEVGGVMVTLAALCLAHGMDMHGAAETELSRIWTKVEQIRAKRAAKPKHSPLPEAVEPAQSVNAELLEALKRVSSTLETIGDLPSMKADVDAAIARADSAMPFWPDHSSAISDPLFHQARGIMGTENFGQEEGLRLAILHVLNARAESAIETPAKVSPCAGHAVQQDADEGGA